VSKKYTVYPKLSQWIADQRKMEKQGRLSIGRKQRLLEIGFIFRRKKRYREEQEKKWDEMYAKLCDFKEHHGHGMVAYNDEEYTALSNWVSVQRIVFIKGIMDDTRRKRWTISTFPGA
jgi:hypothetical protein